MISLSFTLGYFCLTNPRLHQDCCLFFQWWFFVATSTYHVHVQGWLMGLMGRSDELIIAEKHGKTIENTCRPGNSGYVMNIIILGIKKTPNLDGCDEHIHIQTISVSMNEPRSQVHLVLDKAVTQLQRRCFTLLAAEKKVPSHGVVEVCRRSMTSRTTVGGRKPAPLWLKRVETLWIMG